jgi:hypothetical protein
MPSYRSEGLPRKQQGIKNMSHEVILVAALYVVFWPRLIFYPTTPFGGLCERAKIK